MRAINRVLMMIAAAFAAATSAVADELAATPAMWRAADADTEIYLLGTFHILPKTVQWRTDAFEAAFEKSDVVYFEAETDAPDSQSKTVGILMTEGFNADGKLLTDILEPADVDAFRDIVSSLNLHFNAVDRLRPWHAFLTLSVQFIVQQGFTPGSGVDTTLLSEARIKSKELRFFESIEEQLTLFTGLSPAVEKDLLVLTIRDWDNQAESFDDLFAAWRNGDAAALDSQMNEVMREQAPDVFERLLVARNESWADDIERIMNTEKGAFFIAVGAAHLVGDDSVQSRLAERGISFSRYGQNEDAANDNAPAPIDDAGDDADEIGELLKAVGEN